MRNFKIKLILPRELVVSMISIKKGNQIFGMNDWFDLTKDNFVP
jgi:hypothetical protein